jgi:hypothetical protein
MVDTANHTTRLRAAHHLSWVMRPQCFTPVADTYVQTDTGGQTRDDEAPPTTASATYRAVRGNCLLTEEWRVRWTR